MPKLLVVAATSQEIAPLLRSMPFNGSADKGHFRIAHDFHVLITGVGMVNTAYALGRVQESYDCVINAGLCGAFDRGFAIGEVVLVRTDILSEMGAQDGENFIFYEELGLGGNSGYSARIPRLLSLEQMRKARGITVNTVHGEDRSIDQAKKRFGPDVETMEGAAFLRGCEHLGPYHFGLRAISNYVEKRNRSNWNIPLSVNNLNSALHDVIAEMKGMNL
jgi:futalosine hydrolase